MLRVLLALLVTVLVVPTVGANAAEIDFVLVPEPTPEESADADSDDLPDVMDNCPALSNPDQLEADGDEIGDACEGIEVDTGSTDEN